MASSFRPWIFSILFFTWLIHFSVCQPNSPLNIETFYPYVPPSVAPAISPTPTPSPPLIPSTQQPSPPPPPPPPGKSSSRKAVGTAVGVTAASSLVIVGLFFFFIQRCRKGRREKAKNNGSGRRAESTVVPARFGSFGGNLKGLIVDENGLDVVYWRKLEGTKYKNSFKKEVLHKSKHEKQEEKEEEEEGEEEKNMVHKGSRSRKTEPIQEIPLLRGKSSTSQNPISPENQDFFPVRTPSRLSLKAVEKQHSINSAAQPPQPPVPPVPLKQSPSPPPPPPMPVAAKKSTAPPPPPPPKAAGGSSSSSSRPPPVPKAMSSGGKIGKRSSGNGDGQVKLKPLHWDKVNANVDHSMVWDKIDGGSFRYRIL